MHANVISLTTDFGLKDSYVGEMKAVIFSIFPSVTIVDVTHQVEKFSVRNGAYVLASALSFFPEGTIHLAVVDPGVGGGRRPIIIQTAKSFLVGPDNGLLTLVAEKEGVVKIVEITNRKFMLRKVSDTFHGRDIFAPAAAHLANGIPLEEFGPTISGVVYPSFTKAKWNKERLIGEVLHVDDFGNTVTNIDRKELQRLKSHSELKVGLPKCELKLKLSKTYRQVRIGDPVILIGGHGYLELGINQGDAAEMYGLKIGEEISVSKA